MDSLLLANFLFLSVRLVSTFPLIEETKFLVDGCGNIKGCLFKPKNCIPHEDCAYAFSFTRSDEYLLMEMFAKLPLPNGKTGGFVAVGFSDDDLMGSDTVTDCSSFGNRPFAARLSYNPGKSNRRVPIDEKKHNEMVETLFSKYENGTLFCRIAQRITPLEGIHDYQVQSLDKSHYIFMSSGRTDGEEITAHVLDDTSDRFPYISNGPIDLTYFILDETVNTSTSLIDGIAVAPVKKDRNSTKKEKTRVWDAVPPGESAVHESERLLRQRLTTIHAVLMVISWVILVPMAVLVARYTRESWPERKFLGAGVWINIHRILNASAVVCTATSVVFIFWAHGFRWHGVNAFRSRAWEDLHALIGFVACWCVWFQFLNSLVRCQPGSRPRFFHNILHRSCGFSAFLLGSGFLRYTVSLSATTLGIAIWHMPWFVNAGLARGALIADICCLALSVTLLEPLKWRMWCRERRNHTVRDTDSATQRQQRKAATDRRQQQRQRNAAAQKRVHLEAAARKEEQTIHRFQILTVGAVALVATIASLFLVVLILFRDY